MVGERISVASGGDASCATLLTERTKQQRVWSWMVTTGLQGLVALPKHRPDAVHLCRGHHSRPPCRMHS